jgi:hypothetical protein
MPGAGGRTAIAIPKDLFDTWEKAKINLAGQWGKIPTNPEMVSVAITLLNKYEPEALQLLREMRGN